MLGSHNNTRAKAFFRDKVIKLVKDVDVKSFVSLSGAQPIAEIYLATKLNKQVTVYEKDPKVASRLQSIFAAASSNLSLKIGDINKTKITTATPTGFYLDYCGTVSEDMSTQVQGLLQTSTTKFVVITFQRGRDGFTDDKTRVEQLFKGIALSRVSVTWSIQYHTMQSGGGTAPMWSVCVQPRHLKVATRRTLASEVLDSVITHCFYEYTLDDILFSGSPLKITKSTYSKDKYKQAGIKAAATRRKNRKLGLVPIKDLRTGIVYVSIAEAARQLDMAPTQIRRKIGVDFERVALRVIFDKKTGLFYSTIKEASRATALNKSTICNHVNGVVKNQRFVSKSEED